MEQAKDHLLAHSLRQAEATTQVEVALDHQVIPLEVVADLAVQDLHDHLQTHHLEAESN